MRISTWTWGMALGALVAGGSATAPANAASLSVNGWVPGEQVSVREQRAHRLGAGGRARRHGARRARLQLLRRSRAEHRHRRLERLDDHPDADINPNVLKAAWLVEYARPQFNLLMGETPGATRATLITALQVSIWEVLDDTSSYDLYSGSFALGAGASANVMNLARGFLGALGSADLAAYQTRRCGRPTARARIRSCSDPIPEPSSIALFAAGLGLIAYAGRRRTRDALALG